MKLKTLLFVVLLLLVLVLVPAGETVFEWIGLDGTALAEVPDFRVNTDLGSAFQAYSNITSDADGNFIVTWYDSRLSDYDIFGQRFLHDGTRVGSNFRINDDTDGDDQYYPRVTTDESGRFVVVWQDYRVSGYPMNPDIFGQRYNADGSNAGVNFIVNDDGVNVSQRAEDIDCDDFGNYVVVFSDLRDGIYNIYCQRYHYSGSAIGSNMIVNSDCCSNPHHSPRVAVDADGDFVVVWYDPRSGNDDVYFQRFDSSGAAQGTNIKVNSDGSSTKQMFPDVSCDMYGNFVVAWTDYRNGTYPDNPDIYAQRFNADGTVNGTNVKVNVDFSDTDQTEPSVAMDFFGNYIISWTDARDAGSTDIWAQYYNNKGQQVESNYRVNTDSSDARQSASHVTMDGVNIYYTWTDERAGDFDIYAKVTEYGATAILINPAGLDFEVVYGQPSGETKPLSIDNTGQGILHYEAEASESWITLSASDGIAPDTIQVGIDHSSLSYGYHTGSVIISDANGLDSSRSCSITLLVDAPLISLSEDSLLFTGHFGDTITQSASVAISNSGSGGLNWTASTNEDWVQIDPVSGSTPDVLDLAVSSVGIEKGLYYDSVVVSSPEALNSPQTVSLVLEVLGGRPLLDLVPDTIHTEVYHLEGMASPETLTVLNYGDEASNWEASSSVPWVTLAPISGVDSTAILVFADVANFDAGTYYSELTVTDTSAYNNPQVSVLEIEVLLIPANLEVSLDSIHVEHLFGTDSLYEIAFEISNSGQTAMNWAIDFDSSLVDILPSEGIDDASVTVTAKVDSLMPGLHITNLVIEADSADNSPDTVNVTIEILDNPPRIALLPDNLTVELRNPGDTLVSRDVVVTNTGAYDINWTALSDRSWLAVDPDSGSAGDTAAVTIDFGQLNTGWNVGNVIFEDLEAINSPQSLYCSVLSAADDTLILQHVNATLGEDFSQDVELVSYLKLVELNLPLRIGSPYVTIESLTVILDRTTADVTGFLDVDSSGQMAYVSIQASDDGYVSPGTGALFTMHYSSDSLGIEGAVPVDTFFSVANPFFAVDKYGDTTVPHIEYGTIYLGASTAADEIRQLEDIGSFALYQNRPNPFNASTTIAFSVPTVGDVIIELYNILGQRICDLYSGNLDAGQFEITVSESLSDLASGIYFYRLRHEHGSLVKKMVVLK